MLLENRAHYPDLEAAIEGTLTPAEIISQLQLVPVDYLTFESDHAVGQLVVASVLAGEVQEIFGKIRDSKFPIFSIIPIARFGHDDCLSITHNNTSSFNYRMVSGTNIRSMHASGRAIDINPIINPNYNFDGTLVTKSIPYKVYDPVAKGSIVEDGAVVRAFEDFGWEWGGYFEDSIDLQHLTKD